ncbi:hypothetical protein GSF70_00390 [Flavobacteriaceae bacterium W22]|nr:hypothetical protein [Flavobacteriaceae bacterium W22]
MHSWKKNITATKHYTVFTTVVVFFVFLFPVSLFSQKANPDSLTQNKELKPAAKEKLTSDRNAIVKSQDSNPVLYVKEGVTVYNFDNINNIRIVEIRENSEKPVRVAKISVHKKQKKKEHIRIAVKKATVPNKFTYKSFPNHSRFTVESLVKNVAVIISNSSNHKNVSGLANIYTPFIAFYAIPESNFGENSFLYYNIVSQNNFARPPPVKIS